MTWYAPEPRNPASMTAAQVDERVREILNSASATGSYAPLSIPWGAVSLPLVSAFPLSPADRDEINFLDEDTAAVSRWIYLKSRAAWVEVRSPGDQPGIMGWTASATAPTGWLAADGTAVNRTTYAGLFDAIGTAFGVGDGSTTFNLPNVEDRVPVGAGGTYALAATGGAATHTLSAAEMPSHTHTGPSHTHAPSSAAFALTNFVAQVAAGADFAAVNGQSSATGSGGTGATGSAGSGGAHNNLQPYVALTPIIRT